MTDVLFGSLPQLWPAIPVPTYGYFQPSVASPNRPVSTMPPALASGPVGPLPGSAATFTLSEIPNGITAQALLTGVAIRRGQPMGPASDSEIEDFLSDALDLAPGASDVEVRCENGRVLLTGTVSHKRLKRDVGEIAWAIPNVNDVQNNVTIATRRRSRGREAEPQAAVAARKQSA